MIGSKYKASTVVLWMVMGQLYGQSYWPNFGELHSLVIRGPHAPCMYPFTEMLVGLDFVGSVVKHGQPRMATRAHVCSFERCISPR